MQQPVPEQMNRNLLALELNYRIHQKTVVKWLFVRLNFIGDDQTIMSELKVARYHFRFIFILMKRHAFARSTTISSAANTTLEVRDNI